MYHLVLFDNKGKKANAKTQTKQSEKKADGQKKLATHYSRRRAAIRLRASMVTALRKNDEKLGVAQDESETKDGGMNRPRPWDTCLRRKLSAWRPREPKLLTTNVTTRMRDRGGGAPRAEIV